MRKVFEILKNVGRSVPSSLLTFPDRTEPASTDQNEDPDLSYRQRLYEVYTNLKESSQLLHPLPEWTRDEPYNVNPDGFKATPRLQAAVAAATAYTPSKWLLERELSLRDSRDSGAHPGGKSWDPMGTQDVHEAAAFEKLAGLALSGGGVRSATFCLGILQALAASDLLKKFDYLSTVSGGGYIHQWLAYWIHNDPQGLSSVQRQLIPVPQNNSKPRGPEQIRWLRRYSSYLTPQRGVFSVDTWTMIAIWFRNTFLNQIVLFGFLASCLLVIRGVTSPFLPPISASEAVPSPIHLSRAWAFVSLFITFFTSVRFAFALYSQTGRRKDVRTRIWGALTTSGVLCWLVIPGFLNSLLLTLSLAGKFSMDKWRCFPLILSCWGIYVLGLLCAVTFGGRATHTFNEVRRAGNIRSYLVGGAFFVFAIAWAALSFSAVLYLSTPAGPGSTPRLKTLAQGTANFLTQHLDHSPSVKLHQDITNDGKAVSTLDIDLTRPASTKAATPYQTACLLVIFAPVVFFYLQFLAIRLQLGVLGRFYTESRREWLARLGGWAAIVSSVWMALGLIALVGPDIFDWFFHKGTLRWLSGMLSVIALHAITLYVGHSGKTDGQPKAGTLFGYSALDLLGMVGAPVCILSLLIIVSGLIDKLIRWSHPSGSSVWLCLFVSFAVIGIFLFFGWRVDVNAFSLHAFYRDRLARCYLGASNPRRNPDPFSGFDDHNEIGSPRAVAEGHPLSGFLPKRFQTKPPSEAYDGPFPIFCSTVNLTFGEDLAWQERKGASFAFTPLYCGYHVGWTAETSSRSGADTTFNGYVPTLNYGYSNPGIDLSTVAAVSGAALSPNQGFSTQPALAFLMTLFNIRLGWWLANPRKPKIWPASQKVPTPSVGLLYLLSELFGLANDTSNYVCLADGGRFENMGMYELVRRRCRLIVVCDGEQEDGTFDGIGKAVAKCRTDFDVEIDLDLSPLAPHPVTGRSQEHFRVGTIRYPAPPGGAGHYSSYFGNIIYLKTTICGDEPADVLHHKLANPAFPQDSTLNQWFNESQFESYRKLGELIGTLASGDIHKYM